MKNLKKLFLVLAIFTISIGYSQIETTISAPNTASVNDSILAISNAKKAKHIAFSELRARVLTDITKLSIDTLDFNSGGDMIWNDDEFTVNLSTTLGPVIQIGQETFILIYNDTGVQIDNFTPLRPKSATLVGSVTIPTVELARSDVFSSAEGTLMVATHDIANGAVGFAVRFGRARDGDTSMWSPGDDLFLAPTGGLTNVRPEFPNYDISMGGVLVVHATEGQIFVSITRDIFDTFKNFHNGTFRERISFTTSSDGATVTGSLEPENGHPDMTMIFSDGFEMLDTSPAIDITLTPGTDANPQVNYVYVPESTKVLTLSTSSFPTTTEHIKVATIVLQSAATTQTSGALKNRNWNDPIENTTSFQGHMSHITERLRKENALWDSGVLGASTIVGVAPHDVYLSNTSGVVFQLHRQTFPAYDMQTGDDAHIVNHFTTPYVAVTNLNGQISDALGVTLVNSSFPVVVWGVQNKSGETSHIMVNLPTGKYAKNSPQNAVDDLLNYSVYTIPKLFEGVGFLIARFTYTLDAGGTSWTLFDTQDLRGFVTNTTAGGGGGGGSGITELTGLFDTPSSYIGEGGKVLAVASGETATEFIDNVAFTDASNTFTQIQIASTVPTLDTHLTNKLYVDTQDDTFDLNSKNYSFGESYIVNYRDRVLDDGGTYFPNSAGYEYGKNKQLGLDRDLSFIMIPSGVKATTLYSQKPFTEGQFTYARNSTATYTDEDGIIRTAEIDVPRVDYTDGDEVLLLEPQSTNIYLNSAVMVTQGVTTTAIPFTVSFYGTGTITFTGTHTGSLVGTGINDRVSLTFTPSAGTLTSTVSGTVTNGQCENLGYATSFILTSGSSVTRLADATNNAGNVNTFNSEEGVLYVEMAALFDDLTFRNITISDGTTNNRVIIFYRATSNELRGRVEVATVAVASITTIVTTTDFLKIALKWKLNDFALWINGIEVGSDLGGVSFGSSVLTELSFDRGDGAEDFYGKVKDLRVYKRALTDTELELLTKQ